MNERIKAILRGIFMVILAVNATLVAKGVSPLDNTVLTEVLSYILGAVAVIWTWWKNNNITDAAIAGQYVVETLKSLNPEAKEELTDGKGEEDE